MHAVKRGPRTTGDLLEGTTQRAARGGQVEFPADVTGEGAVIAGERAVSSAAAELLLRTAGRVGLEEVPC